MHIQWERKPIIFYLDGVSFCWAFCNGDTRTGSKGAWIWNLGEDTDARPLGNEIDSKRRRGVGRGCRDFLTRAERTLSRQLPETLAESSVWSLRYLLFSVWRRIQCSFLIIRVFIISFRFSNNSIRNVSSYWTHLEWRIKTIVSTIIDRPIQKTGSRSFYR